MNILNSSEHYFSQKYKLFCDEIDYFNFSYDCDSDIIFFVNNVLFLYEPEFYFHLDKILQKQTQPIENLILMETKNLLILNNNITPSVSNILANGIDLFSCQYYYNSLISVPVFDYLLNFLSAEILYIPHSVFDKLSNGTIDETLKSTPTILKIIKKNKNFNVDYIFNFLFTNDYMQYDLRSLYSHYMFKNISQIKALSHIYYLFIINWVLIKNTKGLIYEKK